MDRKYTLSKIQISAIKKMEIITELLTELQEYAQTQINNLDLLQTDFRIQYIETMDLLDMLKLK